MNNPLQAVVGELDFGDDLEAGPIGTAATGDRRSYCRS
jgi:hypothetical protein